jgi:hypothetical protein
MSLLAEFIVDSISLSKLSLEISNELSSGENIFDAEMPMKQNVIGNITAVVVFSIFSKQAMKIANFCHCPNRKVLPCP